VKQSARAVCASYRTSTSGAEEILPIDHHCLTCPKAGMLPLKNRIAGPTIDPPMGVDRPPPKANAQAET
jgi:hypothetical protein